MEGLFQKINIDYKKNTHISSLDGIRGAGMITVMLYHFFRFPYGAWFSMDSFFVLSGFLITGILLDTKSDKSYFKNYIARRMLRILPLYYIVLIIFFIIIPLFVNKSTLSEYSVYYENEGYFWFYLQNWIMLSHIGPFTRGSAHIFLHLWSLAIEEQFYIVWPFLVWIFSTKNLTRVIGVLILLSIGLSCYYFFTGHQFQYTYFNTFCRLNSLCMGGLLAIAVRNNTIIPALNKIVPYIFKILLVVLLGAIVIARPQTPKSLFLEPLGTTFFSIFFAAMILYCLSTHTKNIVKRILESKVLLFFGRYSYSMYIFHVPIITLVRPYLQTKLHGHVPGPIVFFISNFLSIALVILVGQFTWYFIEKPSLKLKRFFKYNTENKEVILPNGEAIEVAATASAE